jgi:hypothetical protein
MTGWKRVFNSEFVPEWCVLGLLAGLDVLAAQRVQLDIIVTARDFLLLGLALLATAALRGAGLRRGGLMAEYFALTLASVSVICVLSYACLASSGPLADPRLAAMDRALGFDWITGYRFVAGHPWLHAFLGFGYASLCYQGLYFCVLLGVMDRKSRLRETFWLVLGCSLLACLGALLVPALGPAKAYGIGTTNGFIPEMERLIAGRDLRFALSHMTGVVTFPSFHTAMALVYVWAFRGTGPVGRLVAALNFVMLCAVPWFGGHYLSDMIAGTATMLLALGTVKAAPVIWGRLSAGYASPESAGASASA